MATLIELPLNSGMDQGVDRVWQDGQVLAYAQNCRLARDGRLEVRPGFTALSTDTYSANPLVAFDVTNFKGRLTALGTQSTTITTRPTDLFEYVESTSTWRATSGDNVGALTGPRLPRLTDVRALGQVPDLPTSIHTAGLAAGGGYVCVVYEMLGAGTSVVHVIDPETDQTLILEVVGIERPQVVYSGTDFWIVGHDSDEDIVATNFDPSTDETLPALTTLVSNATAVEDIAAKPCGTGWVLAYATASSCEVYRYNSAGVQQATWTAFASNTTSVALACNSAGTLISVARQASTSLYSLSTFNAAGTLQTGPTSLFGGGGGSGTRIGMTLDSTELVIFGVDELNSTSLIQRVVQAGHSTGVTRNYRDARLEGAPVTVGGTVFAGFVDLTATNFTLGTYHVLDEGTLIPQAFLAPQLCDTTTTSANEAQYMTVDGTKIYWVVVSVGQDGGNFGGLKLRAAVYEAETSGLERRQTVQVGGELLIAGGLPLSYDGRTLCETGFAERPVVASSAEGTVGALTALGVYRAIAVWEAYDAGGRLLRSQASTFATRTLTGANDSITWTVTTPHSLRRNPAYADQGQTIRVSIYRTEAGEGVFFLDGQVTIDTSTDIGSFVTIVSTSSDALLRDNLVLYEQSQTPVSHVSPPPWRYGAAARERAFVGGLPEPEAHMASKLLFPGEPVEFAPLGQLGFSGRVPEPITAVGAFETVGLVWTLSSIWQVPGRGPEHNGEGEFDAAAPIAAPGGAIDWRSVLITPAGAFFQMREDRLMLLSRGGEVTWAGSPVQDTLALYPDISGVAFVRSLDQVVFACNNALGTDGVFLIFDLSTGQWFVDTIGAKIDAICEYQGRLVYVSGGTVFLQDEAIASGAAALPTVRLETASLRPFTALGEGDVLGVKLLGTFLGACTVEAFISYNDGASWVSLGSYAITLADASPDVSNPTGIALGMVTKEWTPNRRQTDRFRLRFDMTNATNTGGLRLHAIAFEAEALTGSVRLPAGSKR